MQRRYLVSAVAIAVGLANQGVGSAANFLRSFSLSAKPHVRAAGQPGGRAHGAKAKPAAANQSTLANAGVRIGVDVAKGGAITFFGKASGGENLVNTYDLGREVQASYYAGPTPYGNPQAPYENMPWNPIVAGDISGKSSRVLASSNDGKTIYVKSIPKQWALRGVDCECVFEQWVTLEGNAAWVRNRLTNSRSDKTQYQALPQELPAVYTIGKLNRLVTYGGTNPYANDTLTTVTSLKDGLRFLATEHWAAYVDGSGRGVGVYEPDVTEFWAQFFGKPGAGSSPDFASGYVTPTTNEILDHNVVYDFRYALVLGTTTEIRSFATAHRTLVGGPEFRFQADRDHWTYMNATDSGWPVQGALKIDLRQNDPQLLGPQKLWPAGVSTIYVRAAYRGAVQGDADCFYHGSGQSFSTDQRATFRIIADGRYHTYAVKLPAGASTQSITQLRFDPSYGNQPGATAELAYIAPQPIPALDAVG